MKAIVAIHIRQLEDIIEKLAFDLKECHAAEVDSAHYGDNPEECLYCQHIKEAETMLELKGRKLPELPG
jgi:hypothetical protein